MARPVSRAELARMFGISRAAVTQRCQGGWAAACERDRVDLDHPLIRAAALKRGVDLSQTDGVPTAPPKSAPPPVGEPTDIAETAKVKRAKPTKQRPEPESPEPLP